MRSTGGRDSSRQFMTAALAALLLAASAGAEILPEALGDFLRVSLEAVEPADRDVLDEFGFEEGEKAVYETSAGLKAEITAHRYYDDTGAFSAYLWLKPAEGEGDEYGKRAWRSSTGVLIQFGNYLVEIRGDMPVDEHVELMLAYLPRVRLTADPPVLKFLPRGGLIESSQRHILGPTTLERVAPEISPSRAGFHFGTEAQYARYRNPAGEMRLVLFSYPSPQIARSMIEGFYALEKAVAKRSGPLIAVVLDPPSADEAQKLLAKVRYEAEVTLSKSPPRRHDNLGNLFLDVMLLCGFLVGLMILGGGLVAGTRLLAGRYVPHSILAPPEGADITRLGIEDPD